ncbi:hypothetical protein ECAE60S_03900 [Eoetvoesiella caeni]
MLGELLDKIEETLNDQGQGGRDGAVNIIVGNSGTVIIGNGNSPQLNNDEAFSEKSAACTAPAMRTEMRRLRHQVQSLKRLVTRIYKRRISRPFKRHSETARQCLVSSGSLWGRAKVVANHRPPDTSRQITPTPAYSLAATHANPRQPTLTRLYQSLCPHTMASLRTMSLRAWSLSRCGAWACSFFNCCATSQRI